MKYFAPSYLITTSLAILSATGSTLAKAFSTGENIGITKASDSTFKLTASSAIPPIPDQYWDDSALIEKIAQAANAFDYDDYNEIIKNLSTEREERLKIEAYDSLDNGDLNSLFEEHADNSAPILNRSKREINKHDTNWTIPLPEQVEYHDLPNNNITTTMANPTTIENYTSAENSTTAERATTPIEDSTPAENSTTTERTTTPTEDSTSAEDSTTTERTTTSVETSTPTASSTTTERTTTSVETSTPTASSTTTERTTTPVETSTSAENSTTIEKTTTPVEASTPTASSTPTTTPQEQNTTNQEWLVGGIVSAVAVATLMLTSIIVAVFYKKDNGIHHKCFNGSQGGPHNDFNHCELSLLPENMARTSVNTCSDVLNTTKYVVPAIGDIYELAEIV